MRRCLLLLFFILSACSSPRPVVQLATDPTANDPLLWMEDVRGENSLSWVHARNQESLGQLQSLPNYKQIESETRNILLAQDRLPTVSEHAGQLYNFWQDDKHVRGLWRRTSISEYKKKSPKWETLLDLDKLAASEKENWVFKGAGCLRPEYQHCLVKLSRGGGDAAVVREFELNSKSFLTNGFILPEAKSEMEWVDKDHVLVASDFGPETLTTSGYPRIVKFWTRGQPLAQASTIFEGQKTDTEVESANIFTPKGNRFFIERRISRYDTELYEFVPGQPLQRFEIPKDAALETWFADNYILRLRSDWKLGEQTFKAGNLIAISGAKPQTASVVFSPNEHQSYEGLEQTKDALVLSYLDNIQGHIARVEWRKGRWQSEDLPFPTQNTLSLISSEEFGQDILVSAEGFLIPPSYLFAKVLANHSAQDTKVETLKSLPPRFDSSKLKVQQMWAKSADGTMIPYFVVGRKDMPLNGSNVVHMTAYGGFEISNLPYYSPTTGKLWLEKGGVFVLANIRGGGEFGPNWHNGAVKEKHQNAFNDFIAVAEDLVARKITIPANLAISGGSNGGLLVSSVMVQRPDLFHSVVCLVPLTDMLRYSHLLAGASWMGEYGNPDLPNEREFIAKYSPYQNVKAGDAYPEIFFMSSTMDDRVHPSHARKMAEKMRSQGHHVLYFENTEGGHGAAANLLQKVQQVSLEYTFLRDRLMGRQALTRND